MGNRRRVRQMRRDMGRSINNLAASDATRERVANGGVENEMGKFFRPWPTYVKVIIGAAALSTVLIFHKEIADFINPDQTCQSYDTKACEENSLVNDPNYHDPITPVERAPLSEDAHKNKTVVLRAGDDRQASVPVCNGMFFINKDTDQTITNPVVGYVPGHEGAGLMPRTVKPVGDNGVQIGSPALPHEYEWRQANGETTRDSGYCAEKDVAAGAFGAEGHKQAALFVTGYQVYFDQPVAAQMQGMAHVYNSTASLHN